MDREAVVFINTGILISYKKKILPFATMGMDPEGIRLSTMSVRERRISVIHGMISLLCAI